MEHYTWDEMDKEILSPTIARKIVAGEKAMVAQVFLAKGAVGFQVRSPNTDATKCLICGYTSSGVTDEQKSGPEEQRKVKMGVGGNSQ